uniref:Fungal lipase-like domain-containing protein n=1 Tax=Salix viminalis TaxID=40686 RepID=A0A6N2M8T3_SALVM
MSILCGLPILECVYCLGCARWLWQKCLYTAGLESENWGLATAEEFEPVPRLCRLILSVYEDDLRHPLWAPPGGYGINPDWVIVKRTYEETGGCATPYMIYLDHDNVDIVLAIRGLNLAKESDYAVLLDNKLGQTKFDGGYVHNGLLKAAKWIFDAECELLRDLAEMNPDYRLTFAGHSLGAGIVSLIAMYAVQNRDRLGTIERKRIRCFAMAPARCVSLNLAVRYADVISSVVLQDTCTLEENMLRIKRLYAPGRLYHIVERKPFRIGRFPPVVRTAVPVDRRFEHIVLSCNATSDHTIIWLERESQWAVDLMLEKDRIMEIPAQQRMQRQECLEREHSEEYEAALRRAVALNIPQAAYSPSYGTFAEVEEGESSGSSSRAGSLLSLKRMRVHWDNFIERLFDVDESGRMVFKKSST